MKQQQAPLDLQCSDRVRLTAETLGGLLFNYPAERARSATDSAAPSPQHKALCLQLSISAACRTINVGVGGFGFFFFGHTAFYS